MINITEQTLAFIVSEHLQTVPVLEKYHLDFCCNGKRTLAEACTQKGLSIKAVMKELEEATDETNNRNMPFNEMNAEQLIGHILIHHHYYVKQ